MGFKYRRPSIKIGGVRFRKNKNGISVSRKTLLGGRKTYNTATGKTTTTYKTGIKGLSYQTVSGGSRKPETKKAVKRTNDTPEKSIPKKKHSPRTYKVCGTIAIAFAVISILAGLITITAGGGGLLLIGILLLFWGINFVKKGKNEPPQE